MTQYNCLNVKLSNSQLNKLKSGIKNGTHVTLNLSSNKSLKVFFFYTNVFSPKEYEKNVKTILEYFQ